MYPKIIVVENIRPTPAKSNPILLNLLDAFLEVLHGLDSFILNREVQLTSEEVARATVIKDSMRATCLPDIIQMIVIIMVCLICFVARFFLQIKPMLIYFYLQKSLDASIPKETELLCFCLQTIGSYVSWIDINLIVNEQFVSILRTLVQRSDSELLRSVCILLKGVVTKGMAAFPDKFSLITALWPELLLPLINSVSVAKILTCEPTRPASFYNEDSDEVINFLSEFSSLFGSIGYNIVEAYR